MLQLEEVLEAEAMLEQGWCQPGCLRGEPLGTDTLGGRAAGQLGLLSAALH